MGTAMFRATDMRGVDCSGMLCGVGPAVQEMGPISCPVKSVTKCLPALFRIPEGRRRQCRDWVRW
jgi:hypothetical protein